MDLNDLQEYLDLLAKSSMKILENQQKIISMLERKGTERSVNKDFKAEFRQFITGEEQNDTEVIPYVQKEKQLGEPRIAKVAGSNMDTVAFGGPQILQGLTPRL